MKWIALVLAVPVALVLVCAAVGALLPLRHVASGTARLRRTPAEVYAVIRDFAQMPSWRSDVRSVELLGSRYRENGKNGTILYELVQEEPPSRLVTRIADDKLPFGGSWEFALSAVPEGTDLVITERGEVRNPIFRALSRFVFGHTATIERYLADLRKRLQ